MTDFVLKVPSSFYIDGAWVAPIGEEVIDVISPVTEECLFQYPLGSRADMDAALAAARAAFDSGPWPRLSPQERAQILRRAGDYLEARSEEIAQSWTRQMGAPLSLTRKLAPQNAQLFHYYANLICEGFAFEEERLRPNGGRSVVVQQPVGVCAAIAPWNAPMVLLSYKIAAGLAAGCTFVAKPSPETPLEAYLLAEALHAAGLPAGVFNLVPAGREVGEYLVRQSGVDKVAFTGSTAAGRIIAGICAERLARVSLELGGKSAALLLDDADFDAALPTLLAYSMPITGQVCFSLTRILVPSHRKEEFTQAFAKAVAALKLGDPLDPETQMGPLAFAHQRARVLAYIASGISEGARLVCGGKALEGKGYFVEPTVFCDVTPQMRIAREEIFGPVVCILSYDDENHAIALANDCDYGLSGAVFSRDAQRALRIAKALRTGHLTLNGNIVDVTLPFGGRKQSGLGVEGGIEGLQNYLEPQTIHFA